ncbi:hypothetical protein C7999DRAFT_13541 [Corynascus novoguineensis]|uniref:Transposase n=1 Tax=Corynascus novoguineensis TaxID=1126955 RepID=A0AAN7CUD8_9PEZI|nr:hypothetical protein C7999DRAFT_13541 [Corynascus novoguineensis]
MSIDLNEFVRHLTANHSRNKELDPYLRVAICALVAAGRSVRSLATLFGVSRHAIHHAVELWESHGTFESRPRSGRPQAPTRREKRHLARRVTRSRHLTTKALIRARSKRKGQTSNAQNASERSEGALAAAEALNSGVSQTQPAIN